MRNIRTIKDIRTKLPLHDIRLGAIISVQVSHSIAQERI